MTASTRTLAMAREGRVVGSQPAMWRHLRESAADLPISRIVRQAVFLAAFLVSWVSLKPFQDLSRLDISDLASGRDAMIYAAFGGLALIACLTVIADHKRALASFASPVMVLLAGWLCLSVVIAPDPVTSGKRFVLTAAVMLLAACLPLLAQTRNELRTLLAIAALTLLAVCYLGVFLAPDLAIHQLQDYLEPELAGNWRGSFGHKNAAAAVMAIVLLIGVGIARAGRMAIGGTIVILAAIFLIGSEGKSSFGLCLVAIGLTSLFGIVRSFTGRALLTLGPVCLFNLLTVGTVLNDGLARIVGSLPIDPSFTGRTDVWRFAIEAINMRPIIGHGFFSFWQNQNVRDASADAATWAGNAAHSHNGYVDTMLGLGAVGLVLTLLVFAIAPLRNFQRASARHEGAGPFAMMFLQIWLFCLLLSVMESFLYDRGDAIWFSFLFAVCGLHYLARFRTQ